MQILIWIVGGVLAFNVLIVAALWRRSRIREFEEYRRTLNIDVSNRTPRPLPPLHRLNRKEQLVAVTDWMLGLERPEIHHVTWESTHILYLRNEAYEAFGAFDVKESVAARRLMEIIRVASLNAIHELHREETDV